VNRALAAAFVIAGLTGGCSTAGSGGAATPTPTSGATNLVLTKDVRAALIHTYAKVERLPDSAYASLAKGTAYYAVDNATGIHWAGASLIPSKGSTRAQVSVQDDGGYLLFEQLPGKAWKFWDVGLQGTAEALPCPATPPAYVLAIWHWRPNSCDPTFNP
jgi:hypothetical protein